MPEGLIIDGSDVDLSTAKADLDDAFAKAQAAPGSYEEMAPAPPKVTKAAPARSSSRAAPTAKDSAARVETSAAKAPAKRSSGRKAAEPPAAKDYSDELQGLVQLGWGVLSIANPADAAALKIHGPNMVGAWNAIAKENAYVAKGIDYLTKGGAWGAVIFATTPFIMQVMANHGQLDASKLGGMGIAEPKQLEEITKADAAEMAKQYQEQFAEAA